MEMTEQDKDNWSDALTITEEHELAPLDKAIENVAEIYNFLRAIEPRKLPFKFDMKKWHDMIDDDDDDDGSLGCGTAHCLAGWAQVLNRRSMRKFKTELMSLDDFPKFDPETDGYRFAWPIGHLFLETELPREEILQRVEKVLIDHGYEIVEE